MNLNWLHHSYSLEDLVKSSSFRKWVWGEASSRQKEYWDQWIKDDPKNRELANKAQQELAGFSIHQNARSDARRSWKTLEDELGEHPNLRKIKASPSKRSNRIKWVWKVAAAMILAAITGLSVYYNYPVNQQKNGHPFVGREIKTDYKERKEIALPDGSRITLNAHSILIYTKKSDNPYDIEVYLQGEAFFSIAKRSGHNSMPFRVRTVSGEIKVLGTEFVVSTRNSRTRAVLQEGRIAFEPMMKPAGRVLLKPGEMAEFDRSWDVVHKKKVNPFVYSSWRTSTLVFDETPLAEVIDRIEYTFGVDVMVKDPDLFAQRITGSVDNAGLEVITSALSKTLDTPLKITESTVYFGK